MKEPKKYTPPKPTPKNVVIKPKSITDLPDIELYFEALKEDGILNKLAKKKELTPTKLKKFPVSQICEITNCESTRLEPGDLLVYADSGKFTVNTGGI